MYANTIIRVLQRQIALPNILPSVQNFSFLKEVRENMCLCLGKPSKNVKKALLHCTWVNVPYLSQLT